MNLHTIHLVRQFHEKFGHPIANAPTVASPDSRVLRLRLILEEAAELAQAAGLTIFVRSYAEGEPLVDINHSGGSPDIVGMADALGDLDYVVQGANLVFGLPAEAISSEIHRSNMSKLDADGKPIYREDGKVMKGPNYSPPALAAIILNHTPV